jgi:hypothetical protein
MRGLLRQGEHDVSAVVFEVAKEAETSVALACRALGVSRSTVYARRDREPPPRSSETAQLDVAIRAAFAANQGRYGSLGQPSTTYQAGG